MKFGKDKRYIRKNNVLTIPIGISGIGEEQHLLSDKLERSTHEKYIRDIELVNIPLEKVKEGEKNRFKLYLNTIIKTLFNKKEKPQRQKLRHKIQGRILNWWRRDTTDSIKDLTTFIFIHGLLSASSVLALLTISNVNIPLVNYIREMYLLTLFIYIVGFGSLYYLFIDISKALNETWSKKR